jgi:hypothetical protein
VRSLEEDDQMSAAPPRGDEPVDPLDEVPEADAFEQATAMDDDVDGQESDDGDYSGVLEADPADFADQHRAAPVDDEPDAP